MVRLFLHSTTYLALQIVIEEKEVSFQKFVEIFNSKTPGKGSAEYRLNQIIGDLKSSGLVTKDKNNVIRPTEIALDIPLIIQKSQNPDEDTYNKMMVLIEYLEKNGLLIKLSILAYGKGVPSGKDFMDFINSRFKLGSIDTSYSSAMRNFMKYIGILNEDRVFTKLGEKVYAHLTNNLEHTPRYWQIAAGENAKLWPQMKEKKFIAVGWSNSPELSNVKSKEELFQILKDYNIGDNFQNTRTSKLWQFLNEIKIGDLIVVNKGRSKIIGLGEVTGNYYYESAAIEYRHRKKAQFNWTGEADIPSKGNFGTTLVEISNEEYGDITDYVFGKKLKSNEVIQLLESKKQIILYGTLARAKHTKRENMQLSFYQNRDDKLNLLDTLK